MNQKEFIKACKFSELADKEGKRLIIDDIDIAVFKVEDKVYALSNICPHQHTRLIYDGFIENDFVICPLHGWQFNLETGNMPTGSRGLKVFETMIKDGDVYIKLKENKNWW
jgi:NAD(P)H-dependent nitrite reductase small subunit